MAVGTVRGRFVLDAPALRTLRDLERQGIRTERQMKAVGEQMDRVGGQRDVQQLREYNMAQADVRRGAEHTGRIVRYQWEETTRTIRSEVRKQLRELGKLQVALDAIAASSPTARVSVRGAGPGTVAKLAAVNSELNSLDRGTVVSRVSTPSRSRLSGGGGGGPLPSLPRGGGDGGGGGFGMAGIQPRNAAIGAALAYAPSLAGSVIGLAGSAGMGLLGAGALGVAGGGALAAGIGGGMLAVKPLIGQIGNAQKATQQYTDAVRDFGKASRQAKNAKRELDQAMAVAPRGTRQLLRDTKSLKEEWKRLTAPSRNSIMELMVGGVAAGRRLARHGGARGVNRVAAALNTQGSALADFLSGRVGRQAIGQGTSMFAENLGNVRGAGQNVFASAVNIMQASRPFLREATTFMRHWTHGWRVSTNDIGSTRDKIGVMVAHLKSWLRLTRSAGGLLGSLMGAGASSGKRMVDDLTKQLDVWSQWIRHNPVQVREFFRNSIDSTEKLAGGLASIGKELWDIGRALRPTLDRFTALVKLLGDSGLLVPGAGALAFGAFKGVSGGGGGGVGGAGLLGALMGGRGARGGGAGAGAGVLGALRTARGTPGYLRGTYGIARGFGYGRAASAGAALGGAALPGLGAAGRIGGLALRGAGKAFLPVAALMALLDFTSFQGSVGGKLQNAASGATLGLIPKPISDAQRRDRGMQAADKFMGGLSTGSSLTDQRGAIERIRREMAANRAQAHRQGTLAVTAGIGGGHQVHVGQATEGERKQLEAENKRLKEGLDSRVAMYREYRRARDEQFAALSRRHGQNVWDDLMAGNRRIAGQRGAAAGVHRTVSATIDEMRKLGPAGARVLGASSLMWAREQARKNPKLLGEYRRLVSGVKRNFSDLGKHVAIVNGQILDGSQKQWGAIADSIASAARRGVSRTSEEFARLRQLAVTELKLMGFSERQARDLFRYQSGGGVTAARARRAARDPGRYSAAPDFKAPGPTGDGPGQDRPGMGMRGTSKAAQARAAAGGGGGSANLMGAKPGLANYAQIGAGMGLRVSSGRRPGAITSSGNVSYHASGDAIDMAGSPSAMMRFAQYMRSHYGSQLEELIYTPFGRGQIKNGKSFVYSGAVAADHYDHVHVADTAPADGPGTGGMRGGLDPVAVALHLAARKSGLGGIPGAMADRAIGGYAIGIQRAAARLGGVRGRGGLASNGQYNAQSLARLWVAAGGPPGVANLMGAIGMAESGGSPRAHNPSGASGLWQILGVPFPGDPFNAMTNARMAVAKYRTQGLRAWEAYTNGSYRRYQGDGPGQSGPRVANPRTHRTQSRPDFSRRPATHFSAARLGGVNVNVHGPFHVRDDSDIERIADAVGGKLLEVLKGDATTDAELVV